MTSTTQDPTTGRFAPRLDVTRLPWAENMVEVTDGASSAEMLAAAGLDWEVGFQPLYRKPAWIPVTSIETTDENVPTGREITVMAPNLDGQLIEARDIRDVIKVNDGKVLGQVRSAYKLTQNTEAFSFADHLVHDAGGRWIAAGSQYDDKVVFGVMKLDQGTITVGDDDQIDLYLIVRTSHNGGTGVQVMVTPIRVECENMMPLASKSAVSRWSIRHVSTLAGKLQEARDTLRLSLRYMNDGLQRQIDELMLVTMSDEKARWTLDRVMPKSRGRRAQVIDGIMAAYHDTTRNPYETGFGLVNGLTDYYDHHIKRQSATVRLQEQLDGEGAKMRDKLVRELLHA